MSDLIARGVMEVTGDASGLITELAKAEAASSKFERASVQAAGQAAAALAGTGKGAAAGVAELDSASKRYVASLEREIASLTLSRAEYRKWEAQVKGISESVYAPLVKRLDDAKRAQEALGAGGKVAANSLGLVGVSAGQVSAAMRSLPAQFSDIATQLAGGQSPFMILLQQGGQIKDQFGGIGNAVKALGSLITPTVAAVGLLSIAVGGVAAAWVAGHQESETFRKSLILTGNAAGITAGQFNAMSKSIADSTGTTVGATRETIQALVSSGKIGSEALASTARAIQIVSKASGQSSDEVAQRFLALTSGVAKGAEELNKSFNFLTLEQYRYIKALEESGDANKALAVTMDALSGKLKPAAMEVGFLEKAWGDAKKAVLDYKDSLLGIGRAETPDDQLAKVKAQRAELAKAGQKGYVFGPSDAELARQQSQLEVLIAGNEQIAKMDGRKAEATKIAIGLEKEFESGLSSQLKLKKELSEFDAKIAKGRGAITGGPEALAAYDAQAKAQRAFIQQTSAAQAQSWAASAAQAQNAYAITAEKIKGELAGIQSAAKQGLLTPLALIDAQGAKEVELLQAQRVELERQKSIAGAKRENYAQVVQIQGQLLVNERAIANAQQGTKNSTAEYLAELKKRTDELAKAQKDAHDNEWAQYVKQLEDSYSRAAVAAYDYSVSLRDADEVMALEAGMIGASNVARQVAIDQLRIEQKLRKDIDDIKKAGYEPAQRDQLIGQVTENAAKESGQVASRAYAAEWAKTYDDISNGLTDAILQGGKSGVDSLKSMFKNLVLRPVIQAVTAPMSAAIASFVNPGIASAAGSSAAGSSAGFAAASLFGAGGLTGSLAAGAGWLTGATSLTGSLSAGASLIGTGTAAGGLAGAGMIVGALAPIALGIAALVSLNKAATPHMGGYATVDAKGVLTDITTQQGGIQQADTQKAVGVLAQQLAVALNAGAEAFGKDATYGLRAVFEADGKDAAEALFQVLQNGVDTVVGFAQTTNSTLAADPAKAFEQFTTQSADAVKVALLSIDLPKWASDALNKITASDGADALVNVVNDIVATQKAIEAFGKQFDNMGGVFAVLAGLSSDATQALGKFAGSLDALSSQLQTYYGAFYTEAERAAMSTSQVSAALSGVGLAMPATREAFRGLVESQDLTTESGQKAFAALMGVSGAFDALVTSADAAQQALSDAVSSFTGKVQTPEQKAASSYAGVSATLRTAGVDLNVSQLMGASVADINDFVTSFLRLSTASDAVKTTVVNAASALVDLKVAAADLAKTEQDRLDSVVKGIFSSLDGVVGDFLSGSALATYKASRIQETLAAGGIDATVPGILASTKEDLLGLWNAVGVDGKAAIMSAYGAWTDLQDILYGTAKAVAAYRTGTLADNIDAARLKTLKPADRIASLKATETSLFGQLSSAKDPVAVAEKLQGVIISRISEESALREKAAQATKDSLQKQIDAAKKLRDLTADIKQFTGSLSFSDLSPLSRKQQVGSAQSLFESTLARAQSGDQAAQGNLLTNARAYLEEAASAYASGPAFASIYERVTAQLDAAGASIQADPSLELLQSQYDALTDVADTSGDMLTALLSIDSALGGTAATTIAGQKTADGAVLPADTVPAVIYDSGPGGMTTTGTSTAEMIAQSAKLAVIAEQISAVAINTAKLSAVVDGQGAQLALDRAGFLELKAGIASTNDRLDQIKSELQIGGIPA